jgi:HEPN domain-containing protein
MHIAATATVVVAAISALATLIGAVVTVRAQRRVSGSSPNSTEYGELQTGYRVTVEAGSAPQEEEFARTKLNEAEDLTNAGHYRAAIFILQPALEYFLQERMHRSNVEPECPLRSSLQKAKILVREKVLDESNVEAARLFSHIYGHALCDPAEPCADDARLAVALVRRIIQSAKI